MIAEFVTFVLCYILFGVLIHQMRYRRNYKWQAMPICLLAWPWLVYIEGTPRMERYLKWVVHDD